MNEAPQPPMKSPVQLTVNGVRIHTPAGEVEASGSTTITVLFGLLILAAIGYSTVTVHNDHASMTDAVHSMKESLDDAFIGQLVTEETKQKLPPWTKAKLERKLKERAERVTNE
jgi:ABC-type uncharacterized transport system substrate-binding protein